MKWKRQICNHGAPLEWCNYCLNERRTHPARRPVINMSTEANTTGNAVEAEVLPPTYGMKAVGYAFNPSGDDHVATCKRGFATLIDQMNDLRNATASPEQKRLASIAITEAQAAQMWAVKAITWRD